MSISSSSSFSFSFSSSFSFSWAPRASICAASFALASILAAPSAAAQWTQPQQAYTPPGMPQVIQPPVPLPGAHEVELRLDESKRADAGRRLEWVWIDAQGGFEQVGLTTFKGDTALTSGAPTSSSGGYASVGAGARLLFLTLLVRGRVGFGAVGQLIRVGPEIGLHVPIGRVEPHVEIGGGYAQLVGSSAAIRGGYGRTGFGIDYFVAPVVSLGIAGSAEILGTRRGSASGLGGTLAAAGVIGLHF